MAQDIYHYDGGPVFLYICGESACRAPSLTSAAMALGKNLNATLMALEHRFYGESQPFTTAEGGWSVDNLQWLNTTNALADIAYFIEEMNKTASIASSKWVVIGGSYPGGMAAEFRHLYPNHAAAAWSSSGTVLSKEYYNEYDMSVYLSAKKSANDCPHKFAMVQADIERILMWGNAT